MTITCTDADAPVARMNHCESILKFMIAGNAYFTIRSQKTGTRYTYRVAKSKSKEIHFVSCLYGPQNTDDYAYLGVISNGEFRLTAKSKFTNDSPQTKAFAWTFAHVMGADRIPDVLEFWHEGRCGRCARVLTVPESIASGFGPECIKHVGE
jgi:hypothetical protein